MSNPTTTNSDSGAVITDRPFPWSCPRCRQKTVSRVTIPYEFDGIVNGRTVKVALDDFAVPRCANCGELVLDYCADEQLHRAIRAADGGKTDNFHMRILSTRDVPLASL